MDGFHTSCWLELDVKALTKHNILVLIYTLGPQVIDDGCKLPTQCEIHCLVFQ
jgi:hypothetical protein